MIDLERGPRLQHAALVHDHDMAAQEQRLQRLGGGVDHDRIAPGEDGAELDPQLLAQLVVEIDQRLVEQQQLGVLGQRPADRGALLLAARELGREPVQEVIDPQQARHLGHPGVDLGLRTAGEAQGRGDVLADRE